MRATAACLAGGPRAVQALIEALRSGTADLKREAAAMLARIKDPQAGVALVGLLEDSEEAVRKAGATALEQMAGVLDAETASALVALLPKTREADNRQLVSHLVGAIPTAVAPLCQMMKHSDVDAQVAAATMEVDPLPSGWHAIGRSSRSMWWNSIRWWSGWRRSISPTVLLLTITCMTVRELHPLASEVQTAGVEAITVIDIRWGRCDIKSINLLANVLARQQAKLSGVFEAIMVRDGEVTEGSVSNVVIVDNGALVTAPEGPRILSGVTREVVLALAKRQGLDIQERCPSQAQLYAASEVFLTGTTVEVLPVVRIDGRSIGGGEPGPVTRSLAKRFLEKIG